MSSKDFQQLFPFSISTDLNFEVLTVGTSLRKVLPINAEKFQDVFTLQEPSPELSVEILQENPEVPLLLYCQKIDLSFTGQCSIDQANNCIEFYITPLLRSKREAEFYGLSPVDFAAFDVANRSLFHPSFGPVDREKPFDLEEEVKRKSIDLESALHEVKERDHLLHSVVENAPVGIIICNLEGELIIHNQEGESLIGPLLQDVLPQDWNKSFGLYKLDQTTTIPFEELPLIRSLGGEEIIGYEMFIRNDTVPKGAYLSVNSAPLRDVDGNIWASIAVFMDISEHKKRDQVIQSQNEQLDSFVYRVSHDLKGPVVNFKSMLQILNEQLSLVEKDIATIALQNLNDATERFDKIIQDFLSLTKIGKVDEKNADVDLQRITEDVVWNLKSLLNQETVSLEIDFSECPRVYAPPVIVRSCISNLLSNAAKYKSPEREPVIQIRAYRTPTAAIICVKDNGQGIDLAKAGDKLFGMFSRLHPHLAVEGSGVGLYMIRKMLSSIGGRIEVESEYGEGSTFSVHFPLPL